MNDNPLLPRWRLLDLIMLLAIGLLVIDGKAHLSRLGHEFAETAILLVWLVTICVWLLANASAISREQRQESGSSYRAVSERTTVYRSNAQPANQRSDFAESLRGSPSNDQASTLPGNNSLPTLDASSAASASDVPASQPDAHATAPGGLTERMI